MQQVFLIEMHHRMALMCETALHERLDKNEEHDDDVMCISQGGVQEGFRCGVHDTAPNTAVSLCSTTHPSSTLCLTLLPGMLLIFIFPSP